MIYPDHQKVTELAKEYSRVTVYREIIGDSLSPITLLKHFSQTENVFLLESANQEKVFSRFSYLGINPKKVIRGSATAGANPMQALQEVFSPQKCYCNREFGDFHGGFIGCFNYEAVNYTGNLRKPVREPEEDIFIFFETDEFFVFDSHRYKLYAACSIPISENPKAEYRKALRKTAEMENSLKELNSFRAKSSEEFQIVSEYDETSFVDKVRRIQEEIIEGEAIQVVFSNKYDVKGHIDPVSFYRALRRINPSSYMFYLKSGDRVLCGASPETHLKIVNRKAILKPIAGTGRIDSPDQIEDKIKHLMADEKENAEHLMLLDLARNDLYTGCKSDSVKVSQYFKPEVFSHVIHIVSEVEGILKPTTDSLELFKNTFPAGTVTGAPKVRAIELINEFEDSTRGFYSGCVGYFDYGGNMDTCISIRSACIEKDKAVFRAGAGIVYDSDPVSEFREVQAKLGALFSALNHITELEDKDVFTSR